MRFSIHGFIKFTVFPLDGGVRITGADNCQIVISSSRRDTECRAQFVLRGFGRSLTYDLTGSGCDVHAYNTDVFCKSLTIMNLSHRKNYKPQDYQQHSVTSLKLPVGGEQSSKENKEIICDCEHWLYSRHCVSSAPGHQWYKTVQHLSVAPVDLTTRCTRSLKHSVEPCKKELQNHSNLRNVKIKSRRDECQPQKQLSLIHI